MRIGKTRTANTIVPISVSIRRRKLFDLARVDHVASNDCSYLYDSDISSSVHNAKGIQVPGL